MRASGAVRNLALQRRQGTMCAGPWLTNGARSARGFGLSRHAAKARQAPATAETRCARACKTMYARCVHQGSFSQHGTAKQQPACCQAFVKGLETTAGALPGISATHQVAEPALLLVKPSSHWAAQGGSSGWDRRVEAPAHRYRHASGMHARLQTHGLAGGRRAALAVGANGARLLNGQRRGVTRLSLGKRAEQPHQTA